MDSDKSPGIQIGQVFLGKALFEHSPESAALPSNTPVGDHALNITLTRGVSDDQKQGMASIVVNTTPENTGCYRFMVEMVLLVGVEPGSENMSVADYVTNGGGPTLFPFVREFVANLTGRGRFGPLWVKPINFVQLQTQAAEQEQK